jgi:hypothetical protein
MSARPSQKVTVVAPRGKSSCEGRIRTVPEDGIGDYHSGSPSTMTQVRRGVEDHGPIHTIKEHLSRQVTVHEVPFGLAVGYEELRQ